MLRSSRFSVIQAAVIRLATVAVLLMAAVANIPRVIVPAAVQAAEPNVPSVVMARQPLTAGAVQSREPGVPAPLQIIEPPEAGARPGPGGTSTTVQQSSTTTTMSASSAAVEPTAAWVKTNRETSLWSGWDSEAKPFSKVGSDLTLQVIELRGQRAYVYFPGDRQGHPAGNVWIDRAALTDLAWPRWVRARQSTALRSDADVASATVTALPKGSYVETTGTARGRWAQAFYLAEGSTDAWSVGWIDALDFAMPRGNQSEISTYLVTKSQLTSMQPDIWLKVPYRSQLDGSDYEDANCGPTSLAMALDAFGTRASLADVRAATMKLQDSDDCDDCGSFIQSLAAVAEARGLRTFGLRDDPETLHHWTIDEVRKQLRDGHVVIPQVMFRQLPGRSTSPYWGDHFIVVTGMVGSNFLYNDPVDTDGRGYGRLISAERLEKAMGAAHDEFAWSAFAVGR